MCDYEYVLVTVWFVKTRNCQRKSLRFYCVQFLRISTENILRLFKNRSRRARAGENKIKFVFWMKNCLLEFIGVYYTLRKHIWNMCTSSDRKMYTHFCTYMVWTWKWKFRSSCLGEFCEKSVIKKRLNTGALLWIVRNF